VQNLGTGASCYEATAISRGNCGNFVAPRTMTINGTAVDCVAGSNFPSPLPAAVNGGHCLVISAGDFAWAWFGTFQ
jgi:hypothetical protein